ncbi:hypothetical protein [Archangium violaceum]|uniref:hypothetical protein n=1 Tax=Archangium violaceum TaxID=83451 RepID=UPI0013620BBB|nr:hypothetical protein [Archangium violaceum]
MKRTYWVLHAPARATAFPGAGSPPPTTPFSTPPRYGNPHNSNRFWALINGQTRNCWD